MKVSIFTPTHDPRFLNDAYNSIKDQSFDEWVILYNNGAEPVEFNDSRVKNIQTDLQFRNVGIYKKMACDACTGDILVELDHDDLLRSRAIKLIREAFENKNIGFVYSDTVRMNMNFVPAPKFSEGNGWQYGEVILEDKHMLHYPIAFDPTPAAVSRIWFAPDHVRAYRKEVYFNVGGHNPNLHILDDQDLMCRMFLETKFHRIPEPLYIYRIHGENTWLKFNEDIQKGVYPMYNHYIESMAIKWAKDHDLGCLDLGAAHGHDKRYTSVDLRDSDCDMDLNLKWRVQDSSVGVIRAYDIFEHLTDPIHVMRELSRVLVPGGYAFIQVPSTDGRGAFQDPTHVSYWNQNSFLYYIDKKWAQYINRPVRFQAMFLGTTKKDNNQVCWVQAHLVNLKEGFRPPGAISI